MNTSLFKEKLAEKKHVKVALSVEEMLAAEKLNFATHAFGMVASLIAGFFLIKQAVVLGAPLLIMGTIIFSLTMSSVYTFSTLSHGPFTGTWRQRFRTWDQISIFYLIAGTFTPFALKFVNSPFGWTLLAITWILALMGTVVKIYVTKEGMVPVWFHVLQSGTQSLSLFEVVPILPVMGTFWIVAGGVAYLSGIYFFLNDYKAYWYHSIWHILVITGTAFHCIALSQFVLN